MADQVCSRNERYARQTVEGAEVVTLKPCFLKLKIMINELILFMKQNIHKNVNSHYFVTNEKKFCAILMNILFHKYN